MSEITALLAKAEKFCADIPEGDNRRVLVPTIKEPVRFAADENLTTPADSN